MTIVFRGWTPAEALKLLVAAGKIRRPKKQRKETP